MEFAQALAITPAAEVPTPSLSASHATTFVPPQSLSLPDHTQLPDSDDNFVKNFQEHPQSLVLTSSIEPVLQQLHPDGRYCIGQDSGIYWRLVDPPEKGAEAPDWFYVANVPPLLDGSYRRSYVLWKEFVAPIIAIEFVSGDGSEERDKTPPSEAERPGKFWVYEQAIRIPFYAIYEVKKAAVEVYHLVDGRYKPVPPNDRGHYAIPPMGVELGIQYGGEEEQIPWLRWWDAEGNLLLTGDERAALEKQARLQAEAIATQERAIAAEERLRATQAEAIAVQERAIAVEERLRATQAETIAEQERQQKERLGAYLRSLGINPDEI